MAVLREASDWRSTETKLLLSHESSSLKNGILLRHARKLYCSCLAVTCYLKMDLASRLSVWRLLLAVKEVGPHNRDLEPRHHSSSLGYCFYIYFCNLHVGEGGVWRASQKAESRLNEQGRLKIVFIFFASGISSGSFQYLQELEHTCFEHWNC